MDDFSFPDERRLGACTDEELLAHVRRAFAQRRADAVQAAFAHLHFRHRRRVRAILHKVPRDRIDDLEQDVFTAAFEGVVGGRAIDSFSAWLSQVARNTVADLWRGKEGRQIKQDREAAARESSDPDGPAPPETATDGGYDAWETRQLVDDLLASRSDLHRRIVELYVFEGCDAGETARRTQTSADNVYQVARRFRVDLRRLLDGEDLSDNDEPGGAGRTGPTS